MPRPATLLAFLGVISAWSFSSSRAWAQSPPEPNAVESAPIQTESPRAPHPEPRVIVSVLNVRGPHVKKDVERAARLGWGKIVGCYKASPKRIWGAVSMELVVAGGGKVTSARRTKSSFAPPLTRCLTRAMRKVPMPKAARKSTVALEVQVGPGDSDR